jgi:gephyrin
VKSLRYVVSDTAFAHPIADKSGPAVKELLASSGITCEHTFIVPDEDQEIQDVVRKWCNQGDIDWIITAGGTGFGVRDRTPEVRLVSLINALEKIDINNS